MAPRPFATGLWFAATGAATAMVWTATSVVAADVTDRPAPVVPHREIVSALRPGAPAPKGAPIVTTPPTAFALPVTPRNPLPSAVPPTAAVSPQTAPRPAPAPVTTTTRPRPTTTSTTLVIPTATYSTDGGVVTVACHAPYFAFIRLVAATPNDGYAVSVVDAGPRTIDVRFTGPNDKPDRVTAVCFGRPIRTNPPPEEPTTTTTSTTIPPPS